MHSTPFSNVCFHYSCFARVLQETIWDGGFLEILRPKLKMSCPFLIFFNYPVNSRADRISGIQLIISAFLFDQLIMCTALDDSSLLQYHDTIGIADCR